MEGIDLHHALLERCDVERLRLVQFRHELFGLPVVEAADVLAGALERLVYGCALADRIYHRCHMVRIRGRSCGSKDVPVERKIKKNSQNWVICFGVTERGTLVQMRIIDWLN